MQKGSEREGKKSSALRRCIFLIICVVILSAGVTLPRNTAHARGATSASGISATCPTSDSRKPGPLSLLVVLLDRSGSLIDGLGATDPDHYSTSVTKALADLWPGKMAVIPFKGDTIPLEQVGPYAMSDPTQRDTLKNQIPEADPNGDTPLGPAMDQALYLMQGASPGSRVVLITDGEPNTANDPDGSLEEAHIRHDLLKQFCQLAIPVSPFGLEIHDPRADALLSDIAAGTGGTYTKVQSPQQLAQNVIHLYREWQNLALSQPPRDLDGGYSVFINDFATYAYIVAFRSDNTFHMQLFGSDGKTPVSGIEPLSIEMHYVIYKLDMSSFSSGTYKVKAVSGNGVLDSAAQVYALADYPLLHVNLIAPTAYSVYTAQPLILSAALFKGQKQYVPTSVVRMTVDITYRVGGQPAQTITGTLGQQGQVDFSHQFSAYPQPGQLRVVVHATYQGIQEDSQAYMLQLVRSPYVCTLGLLQCAWERHRSLILGMGIPLLGLLLLLLVLLIWLKRWRGQPAPYGWLVDARKMHGVELGRNRPLLSKALHKSVIDVREVESQPEALGVFDFAGEPLQFVYKPAGAYLHRCSKGFTDIKVRSGAKVVTLDEKTPEAELKEGSSITVGDRVMGTFQLTAPRTQGNLSFVYN